MIINHRKLVLATTALCAASFAAHAWAQTTPPAGAEPTEIEAVVVVGSQIKGAKVNAALPVTVVGEDQIGASGAVSGDELFRSIPQMGDVNFNAQYLPGTSNSARGDVGSVNLRNLGIGNTLVLLNGRRVVTHPTSQANDNLVPVLTYNTSAIPVSGLKRLEVLRDGAAAIYGADAVAGVVNTVLRDDVEGLTTSAQYGFAEGTNLKEYNFNAFGGKNFADGRGNVSVFVSYDQRTSMRSTDQDYTASLDRRPLFAGTRFDSAASLDGRSTTTPWAYVQTPQSFGTVRQGTTALTSSAGYFHIQPSTFAGCQLNISGGMCIDDGALATSAADRDLRFNSAALGTTVIPELKRTNVFLTGHYDISDDLTVFGELGLYHAKTSALQAPIATLSSGVISIPASNYWNPFGPVTFANGATNPNRLPNLNVPASGLSLTLRGYTFADLGLTHVDVTNDQYRVLGGVRGRKFGFDWESALVYSEATADDISDNISNTKLYAQLALSTPDAYNVFNGSDINNPSGADTTRNSEAAIDAIRVKIKRRTKSSLASWDFKVSKPDLFSLPGGDVGVASGVEVRRETQLDDRDKRIDGTITFTDPISGAVLSDLINSSMNPDTKGHRSVASTYIEFAVPLVSPEMSIPLVHRLDLQLAGRYEHYSDFGNTAKPKVAGAWDLVDGFRIRGSWAKGFRAPNLEQINATVVSRSNTRTDYAFCEADLRAKRITAFSGCSRSLLTTARRAGNPDLNPEESETISYGVVLEPKFIPSEYGRLTFTVDYWKVKQKGLIGVFGEGNALILDYLLRQSGSSNPNVIRAAPTADDQAAFAGTGLAAAGQVLYVNDKYTNLQPQDVEGLDLGLMYRLSTDKLGDFDLNVNAAHLIKYYQSPSPGISELLAARNAGKINAGTTITGGGNLLQQNGKTDWKVSAALTWRYKQLTVGGFTQYIGEYNDTALIDSAGAPWVVDSQITANLYGEYDFASANTKLRLGVRNITDKDPPLSSAGYDGTVYLPYARYWYVSVKKTF
ncbi:TonB-dependent receptor domain-containing protein [Caulobacter sp. RL271]|jgi:outer membrane receptor protein involved in Fe transport|uniref:TonB-dependent receptor n=1 Tax=Caulobacter segnis TaxID=88688 RepID=A0ABY4ZND7_9CAUL|nr:TonB-dependent receptor [Caulobacter segnis]USQ93894.1 TonB-dependent receptor [Caulobacter segnis]